MTRLNGMALTKCFMLPTQEVSHRRAFIPSRISVPNNTLWLHSPETILPSFLAWFPLETFPRWGFVKLFGPQAAGNTIQKDARVYRVTSGDELGRTLHTHSFSANWGKRLQVAGRRLRTHEWSCQGDNPGDSKAKCSSHVRPGPGTAEAAPPTLVHTEGAPQ